MTDLEKLIGDKQDALRGRPRDWIDDFKDWRTNIDWELWFTYALMLSWPILMVAFWSLM